MHKEYMQRKKPELNFDLGKPNLNPTPDPEIIKFAPKKRETLNWG